MKKSIILILAFLTVLILCSCSSLKKEDILNEFPATTAEQLEQHIKEGKDIITIPFYEMKDGTFFANDTVYAEKFEISGRLNNAAVDTTYIILSNIGEISFEQAWKASGLSSNSQDYFKEKDLIFVGFSIPETVLPS